MSGLINRYLWSVSATALALGIQIVILPWLSVGVLHLPAVQVGWVQSAVMLPNVVVLLLGGMLADRGYRLYGLLGVCAMAAVLHSVLGLLVYEEQLSLLILLGYAVALGTLNAFNQPLRESLLPVLDESAIQKNFSKLFFFQYLLQSAGVLLAGQYVLLGVDNVLFIQSAAMILALMGYVSLRQKVRKYSVVSESTASFESFLQAMMAGFTYVWQQPVLRSLVGLASFNGFVHMGVFIVLMPLLIRDVYDLSGRHYAFTQFSFIAGAVVANFWLIRKGEVRKPGQSVLFCLLYTGVLLLGLSAKPTVTGIYILCFIWGVVVGVSTSLGRSLLQSQVEQHFRGRVSSVYQFALYGSAPLGALASGYCVHYFSALQLLLGAGVLSLVVFAMLLTTKSLWQVSILE